MLPPAPVTFSTTTGLLQTPESLSAKRSAATTAQIAFIEYRKIADSSIGMPEARVRPLEPAIMEIPFVGSDHPAFLIVKVNDTGFPCKERSQREYWPSDSRCCPYRTAALSRSGITQRGRFSFDPPPTRCLSITTPDSRASPG